MSAARGKASTKRRVCTGSASAANRHTQGGMTPPMNVDARMYLYTFRKKLERQGGDQQRSQNYDCSEPSDL
jgi:hypothetical protein